MISKVASISTEIITRIFDIESIENELELDTDVFDKHSSAVNLLIKEGINLSDLIFENESLVAVKQFYTRVTKQPKLKEALRQLKIRERLVRCAAQYAYFSIRNSKSTKCVYTLIAQTLSEKSTWLDLHFEHWKYCDFNKNTSLKYKILLPIEYMRQIREKIDSRKKVNWSSFVINNCFLHLKKHLLKELQQLFIEFSIQKEDIKQILVKQYSEVYKSTLLNKFSARASSMLTRRFKRIKKILVSKGNLSKINKQHLTKVVYQICKTKDLLSVETDEWLLKKELWMIGFKNKINNDMTKDKLLKEIENQLNKNRKIPSNIFLKHLIFPNKFNLRIYLSGDLKKDFISFYIRLINYHIIRLAINQLKHIYLPKVRIFLQKFIEKPMKYLKTPKFTKSSIPLGIDDGQIYKLIYNQNEVNISLSFYPNIRSEYKLVKPERFYELIKRGATPSRGVLMARGSKLKLAIPFLKRLPKLLKEKPLEEQKILNCDLGLKTFATLSITQGNIELQRKFLDQKEINGKKDRWFVNVNEKSPKEKELYFNYANLKSKLLNLQCKVYSIQARLTKLKNKNKLKRKKNKQYPKYNHTKEYWYLRREYKSCWLSIQNIHTEIIHQISTRIVEFAKYNNVDSIRFEDLRWAKHISKMKGGFFLSTWQVHWFFSQIIQFTSKLARREKIRIYLTNPFKSSKICSWCGEEGIRIGKLFQCRNNMCNLSLDSDLNAARNLGNISRNIIPLRL